MKQTFEIDIKDEERIPVYPVRESLRLPSAKSIVYFQIVVQSHLSSLENLFSNGVFGNSQMTYLAWLIFIAAAVLEVGGDAVVRKGLRGSGFIIILIGFAMLGCYGVVVNMVKWDFSKLLGVYVAIFALISILFGRFVFKENIPTATWIGLSVIMCGGMIVQFGDML